MPDGESQTRNGIDVAMGQGRWTVYYCIILVGLDWACVEARDVATECSVDCKGKFSGPLGLW